MTFSELAQKLNLDFDTQVNRHVALTGSEYITCRGLKFRLSDHDSKNDVINHIDVACYNEILSILIEKGLISKKEFTRDQFISIYENGGSYNSILFSKNVVTLVDGTKINVFNNGYGDFIDVRSAANNLYSELFK